MSDEKTKYIDAVAKLIKLTQEDKMKWASSSPGLLSQRFPSYKIESVFIADYKNKTLLLAKYQYEIEVDYLTSVSSVFKRKNIGDKEWVSEVSLEILDDNANRLWKFPNISALSDLYSSVQYQVSGVKKLIDDLLQEE